MTTITRRTVIAGAAALPLLPAAALAALIRSEPEADLFEATALFVGHSAFFCPCALVIHPLSKRSIFAPAYWNVAVAMLLLEPHNLGKPFLPECGSWVPFKSTRFEPLHPVRR